MDENIKNHFDKLYQRITFLDQESGVREKRLASSAYLTEEYKNGEIILTNVYKETIKDDYVFFKVPGYIAKLSFGEWYNKKNESLEIYIYPDPHCEEKNGKIIDLLNLINDYIKNNYKEYDKRINKLIYGTDNTKNVKVKYKTDNILSMDNVKNINIREATLTDEDLIELQKYKKLESLTMSKCDISSLYFPTSTYVFIYNSKINSLKMLNNAKGFLLDIFKCEILDEKNTNLNLDYNNIRLVDMNMDYETFFLMTNFHNLNILEIEGVTLSKKEVDFLRVFINARKMKIFGNSDSLKIIENLPSLEEFEGWINITNEEYLNYLARTQKDIYEKFKEYGPEQVNQSLVNVKLHALLDARKRYLRYLIPKVSLVKWQGIIENSNDEDVKHWLNYFNKLPQKLKDKLFSENEINFLKTNLEDAYEILGIDLPNNKSDEEYDTRIMGPYGKYLYLMKQFFGTYEIPVLGPDGKVLEIIQYNEERDVKIPEHYIETHRILVNSDDSIFEYYYNRQESESDKINYLSSLITANEIMLKNPMFQKNMLANNQLLKKLHDLEEKKYEYIYNYLLMDPYFEQEIVEVEFRGEICQSYRSIPDPNIEPGDYNLFGVLRRTRNINSIMRILNDQFTQNHVCEEERKLVLSEIEEYIDDLNKMDEIKSQIKKSGTIFENYIEDKYQTIIEELIINDYKNWFIEEILSFLEKFNLNTKEQELFINYILLKQSEDYYEEEQRLDRIRDRMRTLEDSYGTRTIFQLLDFYDCENYEEAMAKDLIDEKDYQALLEYDKLENEEHTIVTTRKERIANRRVEIYEKMIPAIDKFTLEDLQNIKNNVVITDDFKSPFDKFVDYIYFYLYHEYPTWIRTELMKCDNIPEQYQSEISRIHKAEEIIHQYPHLKISKH